MDWSVSEWVRGILVAVVLLGMIAWLPDWVDEIGRRRQVPKAPPAPEWSSIVSYTELSEAAWRARGKLTPDEFLEGPFRQFLRMGCSDEHPRARARIMEFGRGSLEGYCKQLGERGEDPTEFHARARAMAAEWFGRPDVENGEYMLEVLDGVSNHNWRGTREDQSGNAKT